MNVLVTGGAGYIGSHAVRRLRAGGHQVVVVDSLERGHSGAVPGDVTLQRCDVRATGEMVSLLRQHQIDCVMHFAALTYVGESVAQPLR